MKRNLKKAGTSFVCMRNAFFILMLAVTGKANAQFTNGDFNAGTYGCTGGTGWTTAAGTMSAQRTNLYSNNWIDLTPCNAWGNGTYIQQSVPVTIGNCYRISFRLGSWCGWDLSDAGVYITINGIPLGPRIVNDTITCGAPTPIRWAWRESLVFTATTNPIVVRFTGEGRCTPMSPTTGTYACNPLNGIGNPGVIGLDDISLVPMPGSASVFLGNDTTICSGQPLILDAGNPTLPRVWSTGATTQTISVNTAGTYWCMVAGPCGAVTDTIHITTIPSPVVNLGNDTAVCPAHPFVLNAGNPTLTHAWSTGATTQSITISNPGTYWCTVTGACGSGSDTLHVGMPALPVVNLGNDTGFCTGGSYTMSAGNPGASYYWSNGATTQTITVSAPGTYTCQVRTVCDTVTDAINLGYIPSPVPTVLNGNSCPGTNGGTIVLQISNPVQLTYTWTDNQNNQLAVHQGIMGDSLSGLAPGQYQIQVSAGGGCDTTVLASVTARPKPMAAFACDSVVCTFETIEFKNNSTGAIGSYLWQFGTGDVSVVKDPTYTYNQAGPHTVTLVANGTWCNDTTSRQLQVTEFSTLALSANVTRAEPNQTITLTTSAGEPYQVLAWMPTYLFASNPIATWQSFAVDSARTYTVVGRSANGCVDTATLFLDMNNIGMPNVFTPNGDGVNDFFLPVIYGGNAKLLTFEVFNRWGNMVYSAYRDNNIKGWDGNYKGSPVTQGVYAYQASFDTGHGRVFVKGNVSLLR